LDSRPCSRLLHLLDRRLPASPLPTGSHMSLVVNISDVGAAQAIARAAEALRDGRLVIVPTDTVYGIAADARSPAAVEHLFEAKGRRKDKPIPLLAASLGDVEEYGATMDAVEKRLAERFWPGPLTLVLNVDRNGRFSTEGFRVPADDATLELIRAAGGTLRVTSANSSGDPPALTADAAERALGAFVDLVLDAGPAPGGVPSTVVQVTAEGITILREGALDREQLEEAASVGGDGLN